jgi:hypothetical protein
MASNPQATVQLPPPYKSLAPLSSSTHASFGMVTDRTSLHFARGMNVIPLVTDEIRDAQRYYPIVFSTGDISMPLALVGLREGHNQFIEADGSWRKGCYIPAYVRRYPFVLARLRADSQEMTLCFDDSYPEIGEGIGSALFANGETTEVTKNILKFCEDYEQAMARTRFFAEELGKHELLMDGEVTIQNEGMAQPAVYRGFRMVSEKKVLDLRGDQARKLVQNGALPLIYAHLMSLSLIRELFTETMQQQAA